MNLVYKNEKPLFTIAAVLSGVFWLALLIGTFGVLLVYLLLGYLFFLFAHSAFISHLKGSGVRISEDQYPDLHAKLVAGCQRVGLKEVPEAYLLRADFFNALATRFRGRHFVVLFTDVVDALEDRPGAIDFYIGHELGHIHRKHLLWRTFLMPASILPVLGTALRRAEEYTCDRYGVACCQSEDDIKAAIAAIAAGDTRWKTLNVNAYLRQAEASNGFWMSFNELTADYPWLTKRMAEAVALSQGKAIRHPRRHGFAWFLSLFVPRVGAGGGAVSIMVTIAMIGILAAIAVPAYQDYTERARLASAYELAQEIQVAAQDYWQRHQQWPRTLQDLGYAESSLVNGDDNYDITLYDSGAIVANLGADMLGEPRYLVVEPIRTKSGLDWNCQGQNVDAKHLPAPCR
ncbi:MAG: M48 family metalloprotease [Marinobacter sp.]|uniref:M48 family metalloprotease n=1 Tax=Marinobacter sp. TaxID=50741 RepID=UPI00299D683A|nr:M48 family metalloprotease [Marinobacter sp.]MDX1754547.1 M48 family metalloprotease [Marinobacter sp.]